jgi:multiple sugar transport system substrate-binding protein
MVKLGADGVWFPVNDFIKADGYDLGQFYPIAVETFSLGDQVMGLPMEATPGPCILVFNKDIFDDANEPHPDETWDTNMLTEAAVRLTADTSGDGKTDIWGTTHDGTWHAMMAQVHRFGGYIIDHMGNRTRLAEPEGKECVQWQADLILDHKVAPTPDQIEESTEQMFLTGKIAMMQASAGNLARIGRISEGKLNYDGILYPTGPTGLRGSKLGGAGIPLTTHSKHKEEAWEYAKWICNHENGVHRTTEGNLWTGGRPDVWNDPRILAIPGFQPFALTWTLIPAERLVHEVPANFRANETISAVNNNLDAIWTGKLGVDEGLTALVTAVDKILALPK